MSNYNELVSILKELLFNRFYPKPEFIRGLLGDGRGNVVVPGRPDYNYARFNRSATETFEVFNKEVSQPVDGTPVLIGSYPWQPNLTQVLGIDWATYLQTGWGDSYASLQAHHDTHEWPNFAPGSDVMNVFMRAVVPMRTQAAGSGSTSVIVTAYEYDGATGTNYNWPGLPAVNLQPATPPTGSMRYMGIYLNPMTNTLGVVSGSTTVYTDAAEPARPAWPRLVMPSAYVRLYGGQAMIREEDIRDARRLWETTLAYTGTSTAASQAEVDAGEDRAKYVTPFTLASSPWAKTGENLLTDTLTYDESWQEGATLNDVADGSYGPTLWVVLNSGNAPDIAGVTGSSTDPYSRYFQCTFDAASQQAGIVQFYSAQQTRNLRGESVSLSADLWGTNVSNLRMNVIVWTGAGNGVTRDVVGTWGTGNPTLATNWAYIGTPASIPITSSRVRKSVLNLTVPTNANNLGVFIWTPDSEGSGDIWNVTRVKLEPGAVATSYIGRDPVEEYNKMARLYWKTFPILTAPAP